MPSWAHANSVARILQKVPGARTHGFSRALSKEVFPEPDMFRPLHIVPDAYVFDQDEQLVVVYEVQTTNRPDAYKMSAYRDLWWALDNIEWRLLLIVCDTRDGKSIVTDMGDDSLITAAIEAGRVFLEQ
jgi:hypothetical protein